MNLKYIHAEASVIHHFQRSSSLNKAKFYVFSLTCMFTKVEVKAFLILKNFASLNASRISVGKLW